MLENDDDFNELSWFGKGYYPNRLIDESKLKNIFYFTLVWSSFEYKCCNRSGAIGRSKEIAKKISESKESKEIEEIANRVYKYFKDRYIKGGETTKHFENFKFSDKKKEVEDTLKNEAPSFEDKLRSLLYIAFRLRNNLYHGEKWEYDLPEQNENFKQINRFLAKIVDVWRSL